MKKKIFTVFAAAITCVALLCGCAAKNTFGDGFVYHKGSVKEFDTSLFYGNVETMQGADPSLIWVAERDETGAEIDGGGYYYAYVTATSTINAWRTKDMTNWQYLGAVFRPDLDKFWAMRNYWAPAVHYDETDKTYYMYYSASDRDETYGKNTHYVSMATSKTPYGPFEEYNPGNKPTESLRPLVDFSKVPKDHPMYQYGNSEYNLPDGYFSAIDAEPFVDPVSGQKYLLFTRDRNAAGYTSSDTYIMKMNEWWDPDYASLSLVSVTGYTAVNGTEETDEGTVNEGPFMLYRDGLYYLTFSVHSYEEGSYQVRQAVGESPMGPFRKVAVEKGGAVITTDGLAMYTNSSGHHSFIKVGDELYISYHTFKNDESIAEARKIRFDKVSFVTNEDGLPVIYANGPTVTLQPLPAEISGYENKAAAAIVTAQGLADDADAYWLNDGTIKIHDDSAVVDETRFRKGKGKITLAWTDYVSAKAIMIYNACEFESSFTAIDNIRITYRKDGKEAVVQTGRLDFDYSTFSLEDRHFDCIFAGASVSIQFADMDIRKIEIEISEPKTGDTFAVSEVTVLGRASA